MNCRERVKAVLNGKIPDKTPWSFDLTRRAVERITAHYGISADCVKDFLGDNLHYVLPLAPAGSETVTPTTVTNEFGVLFNKRDNALDMGDWGEMLDYPLKDAETAGYVFPDTDNGVRFRHLNERELLKSDRYEILAVDGLFDLAWHLTGFQNFMMYMGCEEDFCHALLDQALEYNLGLIRHCPAGIDGIRFGEDWGLQKGLMMGPHHWRRYLKPRLAVMYRAARERGLNVFIHSCGDIAEIFPDLIEMGVQVVNPIQPEAMDIRRLKREYGKDVVLYGGLSCQNTLPLAGPESVIDECRSLLTDLGADGGYLFGPSGAIPTDAKTENIVALIDFVRGL